MIRESASPAARLHLVFGLLLIVGVLLPVM